MPIVDITHDPGLSDGVLRRLAHVLPHEVSLAVACPEEPYDGTPQPGDVVLRFHASGPLDSGGLDLLIEVSSKWYESRAVERDERCARLRDAVLAEVGDATVGVYLALPVAGWAQG